MNKESFFFTGTVLLNSLKTSNWIKFMLKVVSTIKKSHGFCLNWSEEVSCSVF